MGQELIQLLDESRNPIRQEVQYVEFTQVEHLAGQGSQEKLMRLGKKEPGQFDKQSD